MKSLFNPITPPFDKIPDNLTDISTRNHSDLTGKNWSSAGHTIDADVNFAKYKAIAMACDNGTSFPASPATGQWFYRTDIKTLFIYESAWKSISSFGDVNLYVDGTLGTDAVGQGYSSGAGATKTINYAIGLIPPVSGGNVVVYIAAGTYRRTGTDAQVVIVQGKGFSGPYSITLQGVDSTILTSTTATSGAARTSAILPASITVAGTPWTPTSLVVGSDGLTYACIRSHTAAATNQPKTGTDWKMYWRQHGTGGATWTSGASYVKGYANDQISINSGNCAGQRKPILYNTNNTIYVESWSTATNPNNTSVFTILRPATIIDGANASAPTTHAAWGVTVTAGQQAIVVNSIEFNYCINIFNAQNGSFLTANYCYGTFLRVYGVNANSASSITANSCIFESSTQGGGAGGRISNFSYCQLVDCVMSGHNTHGLLVDSASALRPQRTRFSDNGSAGFNLSAGCSATIPAANGIVSLNNNALAGLAIDITCSIINPTLFYYANNTENVRYLNTSMIQDSATAIGYRLNTNAFTTVGAKLISFTNNLIEKFFIDKDGSAVSDKFKITPEGGYAVKLTNKTGATSVKGEVVSVYSATAIDNAVAKIVVNIPAPIGVIYESGIADGAEMWVVISGIADVYFIGNTTRGYLARGFITGDAGYVSGQALAEALPAAPFATDKHFYEIGHVLESRTGAGLAKCVIHFN